MISKENFVTTNADVRLADWVLPKFDRIETRLRRGITSKSKDILYIPPFMYLPKGRVAEYLYGMYGLTLNELEDLSCETSESLLTGFAVNLRSDYFEERVSVLGNRGAGSVFPCDLAFLYGVMYRDGDRQWEGLPVSTEGLRERRQQGFLSMAALKTLRKRIGVSRKKANTLQAYKPRLPLVTSDPILRKRLQQAFETGHGGLKLYSVADLMKLA